MCFDEIGEFEWKRWDDVEEDNVQQENVKSVNWTIG